MDTTTDLVVLVDENLQPTGTMPRRDVHGPDTPLHLAFSVYVFDSAGRVLLTRRALSKVTWPGVWTNACCGHVRPGETAQEAAGRRLAEELSLSVPELIPALPDFRYRAISAEGVVENEICPVFTAVIDTDPVVDPDEVAEWCWIEWKVLQDIAVRAPKIISPWAATQIPLLAAVGTQGLLTN